MQHASSTSFALTLLFVLPEFLLPHFSHGPITQKLFRMVPFHLACMEKIVNITTDIKVNTLERYLIAMSKIVMALIIFRVTVLVLKSQHFRGNVPLIL